MIYRMRIYEPVRANLPLFHDFFLTQLLPVQLRHGARLIGRWETDDGRVVAVWEYDDRSAYERIEALCDGPYLEMFARFPRSGWDNWGVDTEAPGIRQRRWRSTSYPGAPQAAD